MKLDRRLRPELVASEDETRYQIEAPYLDAEHKVLVATNGWALVAVPVEVAEGEISRYVGREILALARRKSACDAIEITGDTLPSGHVLPTDQDRKFPAWREVLPAKKPGDPGTVTIGLDATQLRAIGLALGERDEPGHTCQIKITIDLENPDGPVQIEPGEPRVAGALALLMPFRLSEGGPCLVHVPALPKVTP